MAVTTAAISPDTESAIHLAGEQYKSHLREAAKKAQRGCIEHRTYLDFGCPTEIVAISEERFRLDRIKPVK